MSDEKDLHSPAEPPKAAEPKLTPGQQRRRQNSVFQYIAILFGAAFVLLLLTFFMEKREFDAIHAENQEQIEDLQQSTTSTVQSLSKLYEENAALKETIADLEEQLAAKDGEIRNLETLSYNLHNLRLKTEEAMDWFWQLDEAFVRGRYSLCRDIIATMEDVSSGSSLKEFLPRESTTNNDRFSPYDRYQEIFDAVN